MVITSDRSCDYSQPRDRRERESRTDSDHSSFTVVRARQVGVNRASGSWLTGTPAIVDGNEYVVSWTHKVELIEGFAPQ